MGAARVICNHAARLATLVAVFAAYGAALKLPSSQSLGEPSIALVPTSMGRFRRVAEERNPHDLAVFWHIPKSAGSSIKNLMIVGYNRTLFSYFADSDPAKGRWRLTRRGPPSGLWAKEHELQISLKEDESTALSSDTVQQNMHRPAPERPGRIFTMFRNPVERAVSFYYYCRTAHWEYCHTAVQSLNTIESFADSGVYDSNWVTAALSEMVNQRPSVEVAKTILQDYVLVGLLDEFETSINRFEAFFNWCHPCDHLGSLFREKTLNGSAQANAVSHPTLTPADDVWKRIAANNEQDMELYEYARLLFKQQASFSASA